MNNKQFKVYCKIVATSILLLSFMMACMACTTNKDDIKQQKKQQCFAQWNKHNAAKHLKTMKARKQYIPNHSSK